MMREKQSKLISQLQSQNALSQATAAKYQAEAQEAQRQLAQMRSVFQKTVDIKLQYEGVLRQLL